MIVLPAIDLLGGKAVRLRAGRREEATVFSDRPWEVAADFARAGAHGVHVVDLDGAFAGGRRHSETVARIIADCGVPVELGGGIRDEAAVDAALAAGAALVVLGTAAVRDPALVQRACARHPGRVVVAVDARDGRVAVAGWTETTEVTALDLARRAAGWGAARILYTDVARDGLRRGPNLAATARLQRELAALGNVPVIASGGVTSLDDLRALAAAGIAMCVVGRALYDGAFTLEAAIAAAR
jgi:phosphoribosylformimino-5-aminoimidazole carboxamide ribotide isomerase